ncbi:helix-turn-helix transcriptional regulator [Peptoniphilaceae bacterium SGI.131]
MISPDTNKLEQFKTIVHFLGSFLGPDYEIILHDLSKLPDTIICIENNHLSGRKVGGPITKSALKMIHEKIYLEKDYVINYKGKSDKKTFRSATMFIKDDDENVIGLLCINFSDERFELLQDKLFELLHPKDWAKIQVSKVFDEDDKQKGEEVEEYYGSIDELMENIYQEAVSDIKIPLDYMKQEDRLEVVKVLDKKGMFKLKGAVSYVSNHLKCSQATIYRYLTMISESKEA